MSKFLNAMAGLGIATTVGLAALAGTAGAADAHSGHKKHLKVHLNFGTGSDCGWYWYKWEQTGKWKWYARYQRCIHEGL